MALKRHLEEPPPTGTPTGKEKETAEATARAVKIINEVRVKAPLETVWRASTTEQLEWYPHTYGQDRVRGLVFEERVGGQVFEDWGSGAGHLYGVIIHYDPPRTYAMIGALGGGISIEQRLALEEDGDETVVNGSTICFGEISDEMEDQIRFHGDLSMYEEAFRTYVESF